MKRTLKLLSILPILMIALAGCETEDECSWDEDCNDQDFCTQDRCRLGRCSYLRIPGCCQDDQDCGVSFGPRCDPGSDRCVECLETSDCTDDMKCDVLTHQCYPTLGALCTTNDDCGSDGCLFETGPGFPGGFCGRECQDDDECDSLACIDVLGGGKTCLPRCLGDQDCRPEYMCRPDLGACFPRCTKNEDCPVAGICNLWQGLCVGDVPGGSNGAPCTTDADCKGFCKKEADTGAPGGVCVSYCSPSKLTCPETNEACVWQLSPYLEPAFACLPVFSLQVGCRPEYTPLVAIEFLVGEEPQLVGICQPACRHDTDCSTGPCNVYSGLCNDPVVGDEHGAACGAHKDCKGLCLIFWPGGYCTGPCHLAAPDCPGDSGCLNLVIMASCAENCQTDPDCREGYICEQSVHNCLPPPQP